MTTFRNETFIRKEIVLDGNRYERCAFVQSLLIFRGTEPPALIRCKFRKTDIRLEGAALNTTRYLRRLKLSGVHVATEKVLNNLVDGVLPLTQRPAPPPKLNTGTHYGQLGIWALSLVTVTVLLIAALWYGMIVYPESVLARTPARPLAATPLYRAMPALPDTLKAAYDDVVSIQKAQLNQLGWIDEANGIANIPLEEAFTLMLERGAFATATGGN